MKLQKVRSRLIQYRADQGEGGKPIPWHLLAQRIIESPSNNISFPNEEDDRDPTSSKIDAGWPVTGERLRVFASPKSKKSRLKPETEEAVVQFLLYEGALVEEELVSNEVEVLPLTSLLNEYLGVNFDQCHEFTAADFDPIVINQDGYEVDANLSFATQYIEVSGRFKAKPDIQEREKDMTLFFSGWLIYVDQNTATGYIRGANQYLKMVGDIFAQLSMQSFTGLRDVNLHLRDISHSRTINLKTNLSGE